MLLTLLLYALVAGSVTIYFLSKRKLNYWKKRNVPQIDPKLILGNYGDAILGKRHVAYLLQDICAKFPDEPYIGAFYGTEPVLVVKDPELLKLITTKDFYYFSGREISAYQHAEPFNSSLFFSSGDQWKVVRQNLTPVFTSTKMRNMFYLIANCSYGLENLLDREIKMSDTFEMYPLVSRFTMACITSCAFGVESDTLGENYMDSPFTKIGNSFFSASKLVYCKNTAKAIWPAIFYGLGMKVVPTGFDEFFAKLMTTIFDAREYKPSNRNDFVDFILNFKNNTHIVGDSIENLKSGGNKKVQLAVDDKLLFTQFSLFFLAGFETSATTTIYTLFELSKNPEVQKKVQVEIDAYLKKYDNKLTYDIVTELPYTFACVEEAMRLYPVLAKITREVVEDYTLPTGVRLEKGVRVHIPVYHLHHNPKYFPDPEVYRPERFFGEERRNIIPHTYMPFGEGPRVCIGMRFAKMQVLAGLVTLMKKFNIDLDDSSPRKINFLPHVIVPSSDTGMKLKMTIRQGWEGRQFATQP